MRIALFTNNYLPFVSGIASAVSGLRRGLESCGHDVFIVAGRYPGYSDNDEKIIRWPSVVLPLKAPYPIMLPSPKTEGFVESLDPDLIHSFHPRFLGGAALRIARRKNIPIVFTHATRYDMLTHYIPLLPQSFLKKEENRRSAVYANAVDLVVVPTEGMREILRKNGVRAPITSIPLSIDPDEFIAKNPAEARRKIRSSLGIGDAEIVLVCVSRLSKEKNLELLLRAIARLHSGGFRLLLVGDGPARNELEESAGMDALFIGETPRSELASFFAASDIFIQASLFETQGISTCEAMAAGLPVVAVRASGSADVVKDGENGILTAESEEEFSKAISRLLEDEDLRKRLGANAAVSARRYSNGAVAEQMTAEYRRLLDMRPR